MKNYVKIFEEENVSLINKTRIIVPVVFIFFLLVFPLLSAFFYDYVFVLGENLDKFIVWVICLLIGLPFTYLIEKHIKWPLKVLAEQFARNVLLVDLINLLRTKFTFEISNEFIQNSIHGDGYFDWLSSCSFTGYYPIYFREFIFTGNNLQYKLTKALYRNNEPFRFYFDITYPDGRIERNVEYEF